MIVFTEALQYYTGVMVLTVLFMVAALVAIAFSRTIDKRTRRVFMAVTIAVICVALTDWFSVLVDGHMPGLCGAHAVSTAVTFSIAAAIPVILVGAIYPFGKMRWAWIVVGVHAALELASIFGGFVFWIDEANLYHRGALYPAYILAFAFSCACLIVVSMRMGREYQSSNIVGMLAVIVLLVGGIVMQLLFAAAHTSWTAVAMSVVLYYVYYCDITLRNDALTKLLSRRSYERILVNPPLPCIIVLLDIDDFKDVNDAYGHAFGDECLITIAGQIMQTFGNYGRCYRTGGDEFVVIMTKRFDRLEALVSGFEGAMGRVRETDGRMPGVSVGYARADADCADIDAVIDAADATMYSAKWSGKTTRDVPGRTGRGAAGENDSAPAKTRMESDA